jgi:hypothetical protein
MKTNFSLNFYVNSFFYIFKYDVDANPLEYLSENFHNVVSKIAGN